MTVDLKNYPRAARLLRAWDNEAVEDALTDDNIEQVVKEVAWIAIEATAHPPEPYTRHCRAKIRAIAEIVRLRGWPW